MIFKRLPSDGADVVSVNLRTITKHTVRYGPSKAVNTASCSEMALYGCNILQSLIFNCSLLLAYNLYVHIILFTIDLGA